jgi:hypothetical protein
MLDITDAKASPRAPLSPLAKKVLTAVHPKLPDAALKPVLVNGRDLQALGLQPGRRFKEILDEAATLQWSGNLRSRVQALQWLKAAARTGGR